MTHHSPHAHLRRQVVRPSSGSSSVDSSATGPVDNILAAGASSDSTNSVQRAAVQPSTTSTAEVVAPPPTTSASSVVVPSTTAAPVQPSTTSSAPAPVVPSTTPSTTAPVIPSTTSTPPTTTRAATTTTPTTTLRPAAPVAQSFGPAISNPSSTSSTRSSTSTSSATLAGANANNAANSSSSSSFSTGAIIGVAVGGLAVLVIIASIVGYYLRKKSRARDEYDGDSPFDKDDFRRSSMMLDDPSGPSGGGYDRDMQEYRGDYSNSGSLSRGPTLRQLPLAHYPQQQHAVVVPSFSPGQVVPIDHIYRSPSSRGHMNNGPPSPTAQFGPPSPSLATGFAGPNFENQQSQVELYGGYPMPLSQRQQLEMGLYQPQRQASYGSVGRRESPPTSVEGHRSPSQSHHQQYQQQQSYEPHPYTVGAIDHVLPPARDEINFYPTPVSNGGGQAQPPSRSILPHQRAEVEDPHAVERSGTPVEEHGERRVLGVTNGHARDEDEDEEDDAYGGYEGR